MMQTTLKRTLRALLSILFILSGCSQGLEPEPQPQQTVLPYGIAGKFFFTNWPPSDSVRNLAIIAFKTVPQGNLFDIVIDPQRAKYKIDVAPYGVDSVEYELLLAPTASGLFEYIAVGQQYGPNILNDWRVAGLHSSPGDTSRNPAPVFVPAGVIVGDIDIYVDFDNLPPQP